MSSATMFPKIARAARRIFHLLIVAALAVTLLPALTAQAHAGTANTVQAQSDSDQVSPELARRRRKARALRRARAIKRQKARRIQRARAAKRRRARETRRARVVQRRRARAARRRAERVWNRLARCESDGRWGAATGNGYYGGLQFSLSSWRAVGGSGYPHRASRAEQIKRGQRLRARQGWGAWPHCSARLGLR
ncbi:MAG: transglycosylase family protein [Egibacteraceae bacterium]